jgi:hypothetical protein
MSILKQLKAVEPFEIDDGSLFDAAYVIQKANELAKRQTNADAAFLVMFLAGKWAK